MSCPPPLSPRAGTISSFDVSLVVPPNPRNASVACSPFYFTVNKVVKK